MVDAQVEVRVFGTLRVVVGGEVVPLTAAERRLLAGLALTTPAEVTEERLAEMVWEGREPPRTARQSLQNHVSHLRRKTLPELIPRGEGGYALRHAAVDVERFLRALDQARARHADGDATETLRVAESGLALAGDRPFADLAVDRQAVAARARVTEAVGELEDLAVMALLRMDEVDRAVTELERLTRTDPGRERRWELLLLALDRAGRRVDALATYHSARRNLIDTHGVEPGPRLRAVHQQLLDASTDSSARVTSAGSLGRADDLARVLAARDAHAVAHLSGPAGIGKTTLLREVVRAWEGPAFTIECGDNPWTALAPVDELLRRLAIALPELGLPSDLSSLRDPAHEPLERVRRAPGLTGRAIEALGRGLDALDTPLVVVDDLDRAGPTTREVLCAVLGRPDVAWVVASRAREITGVDVPDGARVPLDGIDVDARAELAAATGHVPRTRARTAGEWLAGHTGGHPLYAVELLASVGPDRPWEGGADTGSDDLTLSRSLVALIEGRLAALPASCRPTLDAAAAMHDPLDLSLLRRLVDVAQLQPLLDAGVLVRTSRGQVRFAHELFAKVAHDTVPSGRRAELHHAIGLLCSEPIVRAHHLGHAVELDPDAAIAAETAAGRAATSEQAYADAAVWFGRAADHAAAHGLPLPQVLDLRLEACDAARLAGSPGHAGPLLDLAEEVLDLDHVDLRRRATVAAVQLGEAVDAGPQQQRAAAIADRAIAGEDDAGWRARLNATASILHSISGEPDRCRHMFLSAVAALEPDDERALCDVLPYAYMALGHPDDADLREEAAQVLLGAARRTGDRIAEWEAHHLAFSVAIIRGDGRGLRRAADECERLLADAGDAGRRWSVAYQRAAVAAIEGQLDEAEALALRALADGTGVAPARAMSAMSGQLLIIRWAQDRLEELAEPLVQLIAAQPEIPAWKAAGSLVVARRDPSTAARWFDDVVADGVVGLPRDFAWLAGAMCLGAAAVRLGDADRAARVLPALAPHAGLVCWQGTCSYGPVAAVTADLAALLDDPREAAWRSDAARLSTGLADPTGTPATAPSPG